MHALSPLLQGQAANVRPPLANDPDERLTPGGMLQRVFELLDREGIRYCVLHGYENFPHRIGSDVDCVVDPQITAAQLVSILRENEPAIGARIVRARGYHIVLAGSDICGSPCFVTIDFAPDCALDELLFYTGTEVLEARRRHGEFWIPATDIEFGAFVARSMGKGKLDEERTAKLSMLFAQEPMGCAKQLARFWPPSSRDVLAEAARRNDWARVRQAFDELRAELRKGILRGYPGRFLVRHLRALGARMQRVWHPDGLSIVVLGPDGAGKSSLIEALGPKLAPVFPTAACWGFAPPILRKLRSGPRRTDQPHGLPPRSLFASLLRAAYWLLYHTFDHAKLRLALARSTLVLHDRHFVDLLIDQKRYRYGGPLWIIRLILRLMPKPDLVLLLDAPPEVLQARKQEVPFEESARQRAAYLSLIRELPHGHAIDASRGFDDVVNAASEIILAHLAKRMARRLKPSRSSTAPSALEARQGPPAAIPASQKK